MDATFRWCRLLNKKRSIADGPNQVVNERRLRRRQSVVIQMPPVPFVEREGFISCQLGILCHVPCESAELGKFGDRNGSAVHAGSVHVVIGTQYQRNCGIRPRCDRGVAPLDSVKSDAGYARSLRRFTRTQLQLNPSRPQSPTPRGDKFLRFLRNLRTRCRHVSHCSQGPVVRARLLDTTSHCNR